jgi:glutamate-5-semialdehyde dehydrogenase
MSELIEMICRQAREASHALARVTAKEKNEALQRMADRILAEKAQILSANALDLQDAQSSGMNAAMLDRLKLDEARLLGIVEDLRHVTGLPDPVGELMEEKTLPNGLTLRKVRVPLGVLAVIYEARPNVTVDVAGLALKSGSAVVLRGSSETLRSNLALSGAIQHGLEGTAVPVNAVQLIAEPDRKLVLELLQQDRYIDMVIPRGGAGLHEFCRQNSRIPVITGGIGICHLFVDASADLVRSLEVIRNAKIQRPSVCNALDTVLVHRDVAAAFVPQIIKRLAADGVTFRVDEKAYALSGNPVAECVSRAGEKDFDTEWLALILGIKVVDGLDEAIAHIAAHSTAHSDGILTEDKGNAARFTAEVDSAAVYVNASTRFTDGSQFGMGAEMAISTQKLHARGPMGLQELTSYKWVVLGDYNDRP